MGTSSVDNLTGGSGNDLFLGGGDADNLTGGGGENYFIFINLLDGGDDGDRIDDFTADERSVDGPKNRIFVETTAFSLTETGDRSADGPKNRGTLRTTRFAEGNWIQPILLMVLLMISDSSTTTLMLCYTLVIMLAAADRWPAYLTVLT
ncbi:MAG: hypothetical protein GDA43_02315 [Hormoscilla sp. SP5CHS1]|nr:hypothetical protein [Hormoscilla sp. SP12CHS1]MBC6452162.1 hypothetical protein [Hormoscilla sp. SP5CHS1]